MLIIDIEARGFLPNLKNDPNDFYCAVSLDLKKIS